MAQREKLYQVFGSACIYCYTHSDISLLVLISSEDYFLDKNDGAALLLFFGISLFKKLRQSTSVLLSGNGPPSLSKPICAFQPITMSDLCSSFSSFLLNLLLPAPLTLPCLSITAHSVSQGHALINTSGLMSFSIS